MVPSVGCPTTPLSNPASLIVQPDQRLLGFSAPACKVAFLATPYVRPPMMPDTWVPWPKQSSESPSPKLEKPALAREPAEHEAADCNDELVLRKLLYAL